MMEDTGSPILLIGGRVPLTLLHKVNVLKNAHAKETPYLILDTISRGIEIMALKDLKFEISYHDLLRLHLFGVGGDLTLRRNEDTFHWYYVGHSSYQPPLEGHLYGPIVKDDKKDMRSLLWGTYRSAEGALKEDRVGGANLSYPLIDGAVKQVRLRAWRVCDASSGNVVATWNYAIKGVRPSSPANEEN